MQRKESRDLKWLVSVLWGSNLFWYLMGRKMDTWITDQQLDSWINISIGAAALGAFYFGVYKLLETMIKGSPKTEQIAEAMVLASHGSDFETYKALQLRFDPRIRKYTDLENVLTKTAKDILDRVGRHFTGIHGSELVAAALEMDFARYPHWEAEFQTLKDHNLIYTDKNDGLVHITDDGADYYWWRIHQHDK